MGNELGVGDRALVDIAAGLDEAPVDPGNGGRSDRPDVRARLIPVNAIAKLIVRIVEIGQPGIVGPAPGGIFRLKGRLTPAGIHAETLFQIERPRSHEAVGAGDFVFTDFVLLILVALAEIGIRFAEVGVHHTDRADAAPAGTGRRRLTSIR